MMEDNPRSITVAATQPTPACFQANVTTLPIICAAQKQDQSPPWGWDEETACPSTNSAIPA